MPIRLTVADTQPALLCGLVHEFRRHSDFIIVGEASSGPELVRSLLATPCDVVVADYVMSDDCLGEGIDFVANLKDNHPAIKIVVFSSLENAALSSLLRRKGADSVVFKSSDVEDLATAIRTTYAAAGRPLAASGLSSPMLSTREDEVVRLYISGLSISEIADALGRKKQTVSSQKINAMRKLGLTRDADLFRFFLEIEDVACLMQESVLKRKA